MTGMFDKAILGTVERNLAKYVGPIAGRMLQSAIGRADSVEALCASLAGHIESVSERDAFRKATLGQLRQPAAPVVDRAPAPGPAPGTPGFEFEDLLRVEKELARYMGPVARVLVKRGAAAGGSLEDLWQRLSLHIDRAADREAFLTRRRP